MEIYVADKVNIQNNPPYSISSDDNLPYAISTIITTSCAIVSLIDHEGYDN